MKSTKPASVPTIVPQANWRPYGVSGRFQRYTEDDGGGLVNFVDVFAYLVLEKGLSLNTAVDRICSGIQCLKVGEHGDVYALSDTGCARLYGCGAAFTVLGIGQRADHANELAALFKRDILGSAATLEVLLCEGGPNQSTFDTLQKRLPLAALGVTWAKANELWGWGTVDAAVDANAANAPNMDKTGSSTNGETVAPTKAQEPAFTFSSEFLALCESRKGRKGDAWADDEKATLCKEVGSFPRRKSGLHEAMAEALGLGTAEAVRSKVREYKRAQADARKSAAMAVQVRDGKKVVNQ